MSDEKPLHVRVAEALGMEEIKLRGVPGMMNHYFIDARRQYLEGQAPRFDIDWSVTGPLIERLGLCLTWESNGRKIVRWHASDNVPDQARDLESGPTPLVAVCRLLLMMKAKDRLEQVTV